METTLFETNNFWKLVKKCLDLKMKFKCPIYSEKLKYTKNDVVPMPGLVWRCEFA